MWSKGEKKGHLGATWARICQEDDAKKRHIYKDVLQLSVCLLCGFLQEYACVYAQGVQEVPYTTAWSTFIIRTGASDRAGAV